MSGTSVGFTYGRNNSGQITGITTPVASYLPAPAGSASDIYVPNKLNQYATVAGQTQQYDDSGNLTTAIVAAVTQTYTYDSENRLITAVNGGVTTNYEYDGLGRRVSKSVGGTDTKYLLDGDEEIAELTSANVILRRYVMGPAIDDRIARREEPSGTKTFYHTNHQGSVVATTDTAGAVQQQLTYDEYGKSTSGSTGEPYRYTGRRLDAETGLYYYRARYYSPDLGRFLQVDPIGYADDLNLYTYVKNNPVNATDPTGESTNYLNDEPMRQQETVTQTSNKDGSVSVDRTATVQYGPSPSLTRQESAGSLKMEPQASAGGAPAQLASPTMEDSLLDLSEQVHGTVEVSSGYRSQAQQDSLKRAGNPRAATTSQHTVGDAADISVLGMTKPALAGAAVASGKFERVNIYLKGGDVHVDMKDAGAGTTLYEGWVRVP